MSIDEIPIKIHTETYECVKLIRPVNYIKKDNINSFLPYAAFCKLM